MEANIPITDDDIHEAMVEVFVVLLQVVNDNAQVNSTNRTQITVCRISENDSKCHLKYVAQNAIFVA